MEAGSAVEDGVSSGLPSVEARSDALPEPDEEAAALLAEVAGDGCGVAEAVLACAGIHHFLKNMLLFQISTDMGHGVIRHKRVAVEGDGHKTES